MPTLTPREQRTVKLGAAFLAGYLILFGGWQGCKALNARQAAYQQLAREAQNAQLELQHYAHEAVVVKRLEATLHLERSKLTRTALVAEAGAAIQKAASANGIQLGPVRESPARASARELAAIQLEATGPVPAALTLLHQLQSTGYPLVLDSVQIAADPSKPGTVRLNLTVVILDFNQWKDEEEANHA